MNRDSADDDEPVPECRDAMMEKAIRGRLLIRTSEEEGREEKKASSAHGCSALGQDIGLRRGWA
jgi:hypothetical protein